MSTADENKEIGSRLKALRLARKLTQKVVAEAIGVQRTTYSQYEKGSNGPTRRLKELAEFFNVSIDYILCKEKEPNGTGSSNNTLTLTKILNFIEMNYGVDAVTAFEAYCQLDDIDRAEIRGEIKHMLKADKYLEKESA